MSARCDQFEATIARLTQPINGQYPRPWMSDLTDPLTASLFVLGKNQARGYPVDCLSHHRHLDALFNRNGESCRGLYNEITGNTPSPTRKNTDLFRSMLTANGITQVLETNVVCYSTPMSNDLRMPRHAGGSMRGTEIFEALLHWIKPKVLIAHGAGTQEMLSAALGVALPRPPTCPADPQPTAVGGVTVFVVPSLAPPKWNHWSAWAPEYLAKVATASAHAL